MNLSDAKRLAAGFKGSLPNDRRVVVEATVTLKDEAENYLVLKIEGSPPHLTYTVALDGSVEKFYGNEEMQES